MPTPHARPAGTDPAYRRPLQAGLVALVVPALVLVPTAADAKSQDQAHAVAAAASPPPGSAALARPTAVTGRWAGGSDAHLLGVDAQQVTRAVTALGQPYFRSAKAVAKTMVPGASVKSLAKSSLLVKVSVSSTKTRRNVYGLLETKRMFKSSILPGRALSGALPLSSAVVQLGSRNRARVELAEYTRDATNKLSPTYGGRNYNATSSTVTHLFTFKGVRVSQSVRLTGSIVAVAVCQKVKGRKVSVAQLNRCSQSIARAQARRSAGLFTKAPLDYPWLQPGPLTVSWTPTVSTETSAGCALTQPSDPTTEWCGVNIVPAASGSVPFDQIVSLSAKYGTVTQGSFGGKTTVFYVPKADGPYVDTIRYTLRNSAYKVQSVPGTISLTVRRNGNYTLSTLDASRQFTPEVISVPNPTCAAVHPADPTLDWCSARINLSALGLVTGTSNIFFDRIQAEATNGLGVVTSDFSGGEASLYFATGSNGPFVESITYRVGNAKLGVWSNTSTITLNVLRNFNYGARVVKPSVLALGVR